MAESDVKAGDIKNNDLKKADAKDKPAKAVSPLTGGPIQLSMTGDVSRVTAQYIGVGPLVIPCTRGEQKAISGDVAVEYYIDKDDPEPDQKFIVVLPKELAEAFDIPPVKEGEGASLEEYSKFLDARAKRAAEKAEAASHPKSNDRSNDKPKPATSSTAHRN